MNDALVVAVVLTVLVVCLAALWGAGRRR